MVESIEIQIMEKKLVQRKRANWLKYSEKPWTCDKCGIQIRLGNKTKHLNTKKHRNNL